MSCQNQGRSCNLKSFRIKYSPSIWPSSIKNLHSNPIIISSHTSAIYEKNIFSAFITHSSRIRVRNFIVTNLRAVSRLDWFTLNFNTHLCNIYTPNPTITSCWQRPWNQGASSILLRLRHFSHHSLCDVSRLWSPAMRSLLAGWCLLFFCKVESFWSDPLGSGNDSDAPDSAARPRQQCLCSRGGRFE